MKAPQKSLKDWTKQKWRTKSGKPSAKTGERYLPEAAIKSLSSAEYAATTKAKREGKAKGKQFVKQPKKIADKTRKFRANEGGMAKSIFPKTRPSSGSIKVEVLLPGGDKTLNQVFDRMSREKNLPKPRATEIRLSTKNLNKFLKNPDSLTSIEKSRLKKTLKRAKIKIPKGL
jgi:hypothetical protein